MTCKGHVPSEGSYLKLLITDISTTVDNPISNAKALAIIRNVCRARPEGYQHMPKFRNHQWDGYISLMHTLTSFPTGLLNIVLDALDAHGYCIELEYIDTYTGYPKPITYDTLTGITLRDYQIQAACSMLTSKRGIVKMATNSGKTEVFAAVLKSINSNGIVIVHTKDLLYQTAERLRNRGLDDVGIIGDGVYTPGKTTVAMIQTLHNRINTLDFHDNAVLIADECHHVSSSLMLDVFKAIPGSYRFGLSGTPLKYVSLS